MSLILARIAQAHRSVAPPSSLSSYFSAGQRGFWIDPSDFSTMWQDAAGTTPVTAVGQSVGLIHDKSGNANHFSQSTSAKRPVLQQDGYGKYYLQFTSANSQCLVCTNTAALQPGTDSIMVLSGAKFDAFSNSPVIFTRSIASGVGGRYWDQANGTSLQTNWSQASGATVSNSAAFSDSTNNNVLTNIIDRAGGSVYSRNNGTALGSPTSYGADSTVSITTAINSRIGAYGNSTDTGETTNYMQGRIYGLVVRLTPTISLADVEAMESLMAGYI